MTYRSRLINGLAAGVLLCLLAGPPALAATSTTSQRGGGHHGATGENTPLDLGSGTAHHAGTGGGGSILRTILALLVVIGLIYGIAWALRQMRSSREQRARGRGLADVASVPLGAGRALHLVRAGREYVLLGVSDGQVTALRTYTEAEATELGLLDQDDDDDGGGATGVAALPGLRTVLEELRRRTVRR